MDKNKIIHPKTLDRDYNNVLSSHVWGSHSAIYLNPKVYKTLKMMYTERVRIFDMFIQ